MNKLGTRILELRLSNNMTQEALADKIGCSSIMINRYEHGVNIPSPHVVASMAVVFNVTSDYLLGLSSEANHVPNQQAHLASIVKVLNNEPIKSVTYFWIGLEYLEEEDSYQFEAQTQWAGYSEDGCYEIRKLRPVDPIEAIRICTKIYGKPMVVNDDEDVEAFNRFGGQAIISAEMVDKYYGFLNDDLLEKRV